MYLYFLILEPDVRRKQQAAPRSKAKAKEGQGRQRSTATLYTLMTYIPIGNYKH